MVSVSNSHGNLYDFESGFMFKGSATYTTSAQGGAGKDTTIDASLTQANDFWNGHYIKFLTATNAANIGLTCEITDFDAGTDTLTHDAFPDRTENGDTYLLSEWRLIEDGQTFSNPIELYGDYIHLNVSGSAGNKTGYVYNNTNLAVNTTLYPAIKIRYKTSDTSIKAKVTAEYSDTTTTVPLDQTSSTTFTVVTAALTTAKTLDHLRFHAEAAAGDVYYDFALVYAGDFTLPNGAFGLNGVIPNRNIGLKAPTRLTDITQWLGSGNFEVNVGCDFTTGTWLRSSDVVNGQVFYDIAHNAKDEPWQWLDTEREQLKVTLEPPRFRREASGDNLTDRIDLMFKEYRLSSAGNSLETYISRWGLNL